MALSLYWVFSACAAVEAAQADLEKSEQSVGRQMRNYRLLDQDGRYLPFYEFKGKTVLLSFFYSDCPDTCPLINQDIDRLLGKLDPDIVRSLAVLSVSLDPENDTPERLSQYAAGFTGRHPNWRFAAVDRETLSLMTADLGYAVEKKQEGIAHMNRVSLIGPNGRVVKHFYGTALDAAEVEAAVLAGREGRVLPTGIGTLLNKMTVYCSTYDPASKMYRMDFRYVISASLQYLLGLGTLGFFFYFRLRQKTLN